MRTYEAIQQGNVADVTALLDVDPTQLEALNRAYGYTSLIWAAKHGQLGVMRLLVQRGANVHAAMDHGYTALHYGAGWGHEEMVNFLLTKGAGVRTRDTQGRTPLMDACRRGHLGVVRLLVPHLGKGGLEDRDGSGRTALHEAATGGYEEVAEILLSHGLQAQSTDTNRRSPLMEACEKGHMGVVQMLVQHTGGQGLEQRDGDGRTVLSHAAVGGHVGIVSLLLRHGAQAEAIDSYCRTPLMWACENGRLAVARVLWHSMGGRGLDRRDADRRTALHHAAGGWKAEEVVRFLLLAGADPSITENGGRTPREVAEEEGLHDCLAVFEVCRYGPSECMQSVTTLHVHVHAVSVARWCPCPVHLQPGLSYTSIPFD